MAAWDSPVIRPAGRNATERPSDPRTPQMPTRRPCLYSVPLRPWNFGLAPSVRFRYTVGFQADPRALLPSGSPPLRLCFRPPLGPSRRWAPGLRTRLGREEGALKGEPRRRGGLLPRRSCRSGRTELRHGRVGGASRVRLQEEPRLPRHAALLCGLLERFAMGLPVSVCPTHHGTEPRA